MLNKANLGFEIENLNMSTVGPLFKDLIPIGKLTLRMTVLDN